MLDQEANAKYERDTAALIQKFCAQAHRWRDLSIDVLDADVLEPLFTLLSDPDSKQAAAAPRLERLELTTTHLGSTDGPRVLQNIAIACPRLHTVALMCPQVAPGPVRTGTSEVQVMQNMHELNLRFCTSTSHVLDWVDACPNLANLRAQLFCRADGQDDPEIDEFDGLDDDVVEDDELDGDGWVLINNRRQQPAQDVPRISTIRNDIRILPNLTCLELHSFSSPVAVGTILDSLTAPALKTLRISTSFARIGPSNARWLHIALLLQRSDASLEELRTAGTPMNADDVRACLLLSPRLKRLSIGMFEEMEQLLGDLAAQTSEESKQPESKHVAGEGTQQSATHSGGIPLLCPELKVLDIADSTFPIDALASVVSSRFPAGGHGRTSDSSDSESRRSDSESSDGPGLRDYKRLEQICVDKDTADAVEEHPVLAKCISEGLIMAEFEPNILLNLPNA